MARASNATSATLTSGARRPRQVENHQPRDRAQLDDLRITLAVGRLLLVHGYMLPAGPVAALADRSRPPAERDHQTRRTVRPGLACRSATSTSKSRSKRGTARSLTPEVVRIVIVPIRPWSNRERRNSATSLT